MYIRDAMFDQLVEIVKRMNPWWENDKWYEQDRDYSERARKSPFIHRWFLILSKAVRELIGGIGTYDVLVIAGPRRVGKTSLMKKLIEENYGLIGKNSIYLRLDDYLLQKAVRDFGLKEFLCSIIDNVKLSDPLIIILDEASALENWDLHVKNVIDSFTSEGRRFFLIVTGSLGLRLIRGSTNILARRGDIPSLGSIANPGAILPYKFSEYAEASEQVRQYIRFFDLLKRVRREEVLLDLVKTNVLNSNIQKLRIIYDKVGALLHNLFDSYLVSGGYPLILYELIVRGGFKQLDRKWYSELVDGLLQDLKYTGLREDIARSFLDYISEVNKLSPLFDLNKLEHYVRAKVSLSRKDMEKFRIEDYVEYFNEIFVMVKATDIAQIIKAEDIVRRIKLFIIDPFIIHSIMFRDYPDPFMESKKIIDDPSKMGILVEHIVCGHFLRLKERPTLYYYMQMQQDKVLNEIDCICHYMHTYIPVEVKYTEDEDKLREEAEKVNEILHKLNIESRPIIVSKNIFEIEPNYVIIPANTFLLLF